jgi:hypothetical protein
VNGQLQRIQLFHDPSKVVTGLGGLPKGEVLGVEIIGHAPITNPDVFNDRFTVSPPKLSADAAETGGARPALSAPVSVSAS